MKTIISLIIMGLSVLIGQAQVTVYDETKASQFEKNLVSTAIILADTFGPDYEVKNAVRIEISGPFVFQADDKRPEIQKHVGRTYYDVSFFPQDRSSYEWGYLSKAQIWSDGEPWGVLFGNGMGVSFFFKSFEEKKNQPDHMTIPLQKIEKRQAIW